MIIGYTSGVFDLFHIGHINLLKNAIGICDKLIVGVTSDELIQKYKNKISVIPYAERAEILRNIKGVDCVVPQENMNKFEAWKKLKFDVLIVGDDWYETEKWQDIEGELKSVGVQVFYFPYTKSTSSTKINSVLEELRGNL